MKWRLSKGSLRFAFHAEIDVSIIPHLTQGAQHPKQRREWLAQKIWLKHKPHFAKFPDWFGSV